MRIITFLGFILPTLALGQSFQRNEVTFEGGSAWGVDTVHADQRASAVSLGATYGFRLRPWVVLEGGVLTATDPTGIVGSAAGFFDVHDRLTWITFGPRFVLPLATDRFEISAGAGGAYQRYTVGNTSAPNSPSPYSAWGGYFKAGAAVALDHGRHIWLGVSPQLTVINGAYARDRWLELTGTVGLRF